MKKHILIRPTFPMPLTILLVILIFIVTGIFSRHIFDIQFQHAEERRAALLGMFLIGVACTLVMLILWEEILFPIKIKELDNGIKMSNHKLKLRVQVLLYLGIPLIFGFIYLNYHLNGIEFYIWFAACMAIPLVTKLLSGINNYNDFLRLTSTEIEYKNNEKEGSYSLDTVKYIRIVKDKHDFLSKIIVGLNNSTELTIDVDEMELEAYYEAITKFITENYQPLLKQA